MWQDGFGASLAGIRGLSRVRGTQRGGLEGSERHFGANRASDFNQVALFQRR